MVDERVANGNALVPFAIRPIHHSSHLPFVPFDRRRKQVQLAPLPAPWNPEWKAGSWISNRMGQHAKAVSHRARMTATQKQRLDALPYGQLLIAGTHPASCM